MADKTKNETANRAEQVSLEDFIAVATRAALRALDEHNAQVQLNPQPLPPGERANVAAIRRPGGGPIIIGIVAAPERMLE